MEALLFNVTPFSDSISLERQFLTREQVDNGFLEGIVRGYRSGILTNNHYASLAQCETLEGMNILRILPCFSS
jgi:hypothetical protein